LLKPCVFLGNTNAPLFNTKLLLKLLLLLPAIEHALNRTKETANRVSVL
jgi:hypothetical protein